MSALNEDAVRRNDLALRSLAAFLCSNPSDAEDLAQQTWVRTLTHGPDPRRGLRGWQARVLRNLAYDRLRASRNSLPTELVGEPIDPSGQAPLEYEGASFEGLRELLNGLQPAYREVIRARYFDGLSPPEIAREMGLPLETIRTRLRRGRVQLRNRMEERQPGWCQALALTLSATAGTLKTKTGGPLGALSSQSWVALILALVGAVAWLFVHGPVVPAHSPQLAGDSEPSPSSRIEQLARQRVIQGREQAAPSEPIQPPRAGAIWLTTFPPPRAFETLRVALQGPDGSAPQVDIQLGSPHSWKGLRPGVYQVIPERGSTRLARVRAGETEALHLEVPKGIRVRGRVVNWLGDSVAGKRLWVSWPGRPRQGAWSCGTNPDGQFDLGFVDPQAWIGAGGNGVLESRLVRLDAPSDPGRASEVELRLRPPGKRMVLRTVDRAGNPVPDAWIRISPNSNQVYPREALGGHVELPSRANEQIELGADGLLNSPWDFERPRILWAGAPGLATATVLVDPDFTDRDVVLQPEVVVRGNLHLPGGAPPASGWIRARAGGAMTMSHPGDGRYHLAGVAPGLVRLHAFAEHQGRAYSATETVDTRALPLPEWNPILRPGGGLQGQALTAEDAPAVGWSVWADRSDQGNARAVTPWRTLEQLHTTVTDSSGRFVLPGLREGRYSLWLFPPQAGPDSAPHACLHGVPLGRAEIRLRCSPSSVPSARALGLLDPAPGLSLTGTKLFLVGPPLAHPLRVDWNPLDRRLESPLVPPGQYSLYAWLSGKRPQVLSTFSLSPRETFILPMSSIRELGSLELHGRWTSSEAPRRVELILRAQGQSERRALPWKRLQDKQVLVHETVDGLSPGEYSATLRVPGFAEQTRMIHVASGRVTVADFSLQQGKPVALTIDAAALPASDYHLELSMEDEHGQLVWHTTSFLDTGRKQRLQLRSWLPEGRYHVSSIATTPGGAKFQARQWVSEGRSGSRSTPFVATLTYE